MFRIATRGFDYLQLYFSIWDSVSHDFFLIIRRSSYILFKKQRKFANPRSWCSLGFWRYSAACWITIGKVWNQCKKIRNKLGVPSKELKNQRGKKIGFQGLLRHNPKSNRNEGNKFPDFFFHWTSFHFALFFFFLLSIACSDGDFIQSEKKIAALWKRSSKYC